MKKIDWYILKKFLTTFFFAIFLFTIIAVVIDVSEKTDEMVRSRLGVKRIILEYYIGFIPHIIALLFPLFVFIGYSDGFGNPNQLENYSTTMMYLIVLGISSWVMKKFVEDNKWFRENYLHLFLITLTLVLCLSLFKNQVNKKIILLAHLLYLKHIL